MNKVQETTLEIDLGALEHNYNYLASKLSKGTKMMGVVKAFAYGNNPGPIAKKLVELGVSYLAVAYTKEGIALRREGIECPIMIIHPQKVNFEKLIQYKLTPSIYSFSTLEAFIEKAEEMCQESYSIHLNINTGMNRMGFDSNQRKAIAKSIGKTKGIKVEGIYSHLSVSDDPKERAYTLRQLQKFKEGSEEIIKGLGYKPLLHLCNTSGILNYKEAHFDMVRAGIGLYGYGNSAAYDRNLLPVGSLKTLISQTHHIKKGQSVGYNRRFKAKSDKVIAVLPLGYADGLPRIYGEGRGSVFINNQLAPIIGDICMDMTMIDISNIDCQEGDEVLVFGKEKSAETMANAVGSISYELITGISARVKRIIIES